MDEQSDESDGDAHQQGFQDIMKQFGSGPVKAKSKAKEPRAATKAAPKAKSFAKVPASASGVKRSVPTPEEPPVTQPAKVPKVDQAKVPKVEQANVGRLKAKGVKGQKTMPAEQQDAFSLGGGGDDMLDGDSGLSESDRAVLDNFDTKFAALKSLNPPLADGAFKAYLNDIAGTLSGFLNDVRLKKKSAVRRQGKDQDPLHIGLVAFGERVAAFQHVIKCILVDH